MRKMKINTKPTMLKYAAEDKELGGLLINDEDDKTSLWVKGYNNGCVVVEPISDEKESLTDVLRDIFGCLHDDSNFIEEVNRTGISKEITKDSLNGIYIKFNDDKSTDFLVTDKMYRCAMDDHISRLVERGILYVVGPYYVGI